MALALFQDPQERTQQRTPKAHDFRASEALGAVVSSPPVSSGGGTAAQNGGEPVPRWDGGGLHVAYTGLVGVMVIYSNSKSQTRPFWGPRNPELDFFFQFGHDFGHCANL